MKREKKRYRLGRKNCNHRKTKTRHAFAWPENLPVDHPKRPTGARLDGPRNVWNPVSPICEKCGRSIAEIIFPKLLKRSAI